MTYQIDFTGEEQTFEPIPAGSYRAVIEDIEERPGDKAPYWNIKTTISEGNFKGRNVWTNCSFVKEAQWKLKNLLISTGIWTANQKGTATFDRAALIGKQLGIKTGSETYEGKTRPTIENFFHLEGGPVAPAPTPQTAPAPVINTGVPQPQAATAPRKL